MKRLKAFSLIFISFCIGVATTYVVTPKQPNIVVLYPEEYIKTVAHTDGDYSNATLLFKDSQKDIAYYTWDSGKAPVSVGDSIVDSSGGTATVIDVTIEGFLLKPIDLTPQAGMSGTTVFKDEIGVGLVSAVKADGSIYCIWK